jgi:hypothetical protein
MKVVTEFASANNRLAWNSGESLSAKRRTSGSSGRFVGFFEK